MELVVYSVNDEHGNVWHSTALAVAATYNQLDVVRVLINMGAKVNEERVWHVLASVQAAGNGHLEMLELLVKNGCDLGLGDSEGFTPICAAAQLQGYLPILNVLDHNSGTPTHTTFKFILNQPTTFTQDVNVVVYSGRTRERTATFGTPLHWR